MAPANRQAMASPEATLETLQLSRKTPKKDVVLKPGPHLVQFGASNR